MRFFTVAFATLALSADAFAQPGSFSGLKSHLQEKGMSGFAGALSGLETSSAFYKALVAALAAGHPTTLLVPSNSAWSRVSAGYHGNPSWLSQSVAYHTVVGSINTNTVAMLPGGNAYKTYLTSGTAVNLLGNEGQNIVFAKNGSQIQITGQNVPPVVQGSSSYQSVTVLTISEVVDLPPSFTAAISLPSYPWTFNTTTFVNYITAEFPSLVTATPSVTAFVPINNAILNALTYVNLAPQLANVVYPYKTPGTLDQMLFNHVINGSVIFTGGPVQTYTSAGGEPISFGTNGTNSVVYYAGEIVANVVVANIVLENGVLHIIDNLLNNFNSNPTAAASYLAAAKASATPS